MWWAIYRLLVFTAKRDGYTSPYLAMLSLGWATSVALASLGAGFAAVVTAVNFLTAVASLIAITTSIASTVGDREGLIEAYVSGWGRARYFAARTVANLTLALVYSLTAALPYLLLRQVPAAAFATAAVAFVTSLLGTYIGLAARSRESAFLYSVVAWVGLALVYDVVVAFVNLITPLPSEAIFALQISNPIKLVALTATAMVDSHLLTLGPLGEFAIHMGLGWFFATLAAVYTAWVTALALAIYDGVRKVDL